jgi:hypothetical protein
MLPYTAHFDSPEIVDRWHHIHTVTSVILKKNTKAAVKDETFLRDGEVGKLFATTERQWRSCVDCVSCMPLPAWAYITFRRAFLRFFNCTVFRTGGPAPHRALPTVWTAQWHNHTLTHLTDYDFPYAYAYP